MNAKNTLSAVLLVCVCTSACGTATPSMHRRAPMEEVEEESYSYEEAEGIPQEADESLYEAEYPAPTAAATPLAEYPQPAEPPASGTPPEDTTFQDYGVNPFVSTSVDHLSTFGLDVDTASYTVARHYIQNGMLPPADAVRVEEFVNYFDQGYPLPPGIAFGVYADGAPSPFGDGTHLLRIGIQGYEVPESDRKPLALTFIIDVSGSMATDNRLGLVQQSLDLLVQRLRPSDSVAIVAFTDYAWVVQNPVPVTNRNAILSNIYSLSPQASTNVEEGLRLGYSLADQAYQPNASNRVILCSDGVANVGLTDPNGLMESIRLYANRGITLTSIGVGMGNYNDVLLEQLADKGDGNYAYVDTREEAERVFVDELTSTLQVIALDAKVQVDFNVDIVSSYRLIGYENRAIADQNFRNDAVDAGEIGAGHSVTALYAVQLKPGAAGRIATVQLRWQDPSSLSVQEINGNLNTWDLATSFEAAPSRFQLAVIAAQFAELLRHNPWAAETSFQLLNQYAWRLNGTLADDPDVHELAQLIATVSELQGW